MGPAIVVIYSLYKFFISNSQIYPIEEGDCILLIEKWGEVNLPTKMKVNIFTMSDLIQKLKEKFMVT